MDEHRRHERGGPRARDAADARLRGRHLLHNVQPVRRGTPPLTGREPVGRHFLQVCTTTPCELCGSAAVVDALRAELGVEVGGTTADKLFTLVEVECAGACVNAPVLAVNDDYYVRGSARRRLTPQEDLTPEIAVQIVRDLRAGKKPAIGPQRGRISCEPAGAPTSLTTPPPGPGFAVRPDL